MPTTCAMRWSIGVAAMNPVTRCRSTRSIASSAPNRSMSTIGSPVSRLRKAVIPLVWYSGAGQRTRCSGSIGPNDATTDEVGLRDGKKRAGFFCTITFGAPVEPELHTPQPRGDTTSGSGSSGAARASPRRPSRLVPSTTTVGWRTAWSRPSSQSGRSQRMGTTVAPTFQPANEANRCSGELRRQTARWSPTPSPRAAKTWASWFDRRAISRQLTVCSAPSSLAKMTAVESPCSAAIWSIRVP